MNARVWEVAGIMMMIKVVRCIHQNNHTIFNIGLPMNFLRYLLVTGRMGQLKKNLASFE